jgi:hypothetical protein
MMMNWKKWLEAAIKKSKKTINLLVSKKKKAKNTISNKRMFVIKFIIGMLIIEIYFPANFFTQNSFLKTCNIMG